MKEMPPELAAALHNTPSLAETQTHFRCKRKNKASPPPPPPLPLRLATIRINPSIQPAAPPHVHVAKQGAAAASCVATGAAAWVLPPPPPPPAQDGPVSLTGTRLKLIVGHKPCGQLMLRGDMACICTGEPGASAALNEARLLRAAAAARLS